MLWLQTPQWGRWLIASLLATLALWIELRPEPTVDHPFAVIQILAGDEIGVVNTEMRPVPRGLLDSVGSGVSSSAIAAGEPVLASNVVEAQSHIPSGWWIVAADVPANTKPGDKVRVVLLITGEIVDGVITSAFNDDPFSATSGAIAVEADRAGEVAIAAADGQIAVLVSTG
jgi:hypothetical protein